MCEHGGQDSIEGAPTLLFHAVFLGKHVFNVKGRVPARTVLSQALQSTIKHSQVEQHVDLKNSGLNNYRISRGTEVPSDSYEVWGSVVAPEHPCFRA